MKLEMRQEMKQEMRLEMKREMKLVIAADFWTRLTGLISRERCNSGEVLMFAPCKSIHTFGMRCPVDVAFLDAGARVIKVERDIKPGKILSHAHAAAVLERRSDASGDWPLVGEQISIHVGETFL